METSQPDAVLAYDADLENEVWITTDNMEEQHSELEPDAVLRSGLLWDGMRIEYLENPEKHLRQALMFPATWNSEKNTFYKMARAFLAEYLLDECVDVTIYDEIKKVILSRHGEKKGV